jgi:hypothetical protein
VKYDKKLRLLPAWICGIVVAYFFIYAVLSLSGSYQVVLADLNHADYGWVPFGFYASGHKQNNWVNDTVFYVYRPLWVWDEKYIHKTPPPSVYFTTQIH